MSNQIKSEFTSHITTSSQKKSQDAKNIPCIMGKTLVCSWLEGDDYKNIIKIWQKIK